MIEETIIDLREMVRNLRKVGFTEEAIALAANVSQPTISRILSGKVKTAKFEVAIKIKTFHMQYCQ
ncbi:helix-turn-helix domain-containing protein [Candidatus Berkiella aquae]|jgi:predicted transcriptional regulator|uniref:Helix-turn-helix domain-containing protein n=1 Tax=Candidatus Berkiella aquae TaxID=295108 RepID=A0A0Q9YHY7_9GAMM|nr:helix-turn-helix domain-containing protein [Candidatus Berkiella aquae]MCS5712820.1 helix-turn-helix domain-containing protein [Candidatus Berkiella aquae]